MNSTITTLVIILSVGFIILLILSIITVYVLVRILQKIHRITQKTETMADNLPEALKFVLRKVAPVALPTLAGAIARKVMNKKGRKHHDE